MTSQATNGVADPERGRVLNLIDYLIKIAEHRTPIVRNVETYDHLLWLSDIPKLRGCYTQVWGAEEGHEQDSWIEIQNQPEPMLPLVPTICKDWVDHPTLRNKQDLPQLRDSIVKAMPNPKWEQGSDLPQMIDETKNIADHLDVQYAWDNYIEKRWINWVDRHDDWEKIHRPYSKLFQIYQQQLRSREDYELVLAFGLLTWKSTTNHQIRRHLIVADVELEFESKSGKFTLTPNEGGANFRLELDMLDIDDQPAETGSQAKSELSEISTQIGDRSHIEGILNSVANSISPRSQYKDSLEILPTQWTEKAIVEYAPALILRRRSTRGLTETLRSIRQAVEAGGAIPSNFGDLAEIEQRPKKSSDRSSDDRSLPDERIFFPLLANDEQRRIVRQLDHQRCVLVQGPPGTGKSQTIVNLICHLLATGRRILVTAKTPRALQVIEGLMPEPLRPLCISRLGHGSEEQRSLERSVNGILRKNQEWDESDVTEKIDRLESNYDSKQRKLARVSRKQRKLRKSETRSYTVIPRDYVGTPAYIAEKWSKERSKHEWLIDDAELGAHSTFNSTELLHILRELRHFNPDLRKMLQLDLPPESIPSTDDFKDLVHREQWANQQIQLAERHADLNLSKDLQATSSRQVIEIIRKHLAAYESAYQKAVRTLRLSGNKWMREVLCSINSDDYSDWWNLYDSTKSRLATIDELFGVVGNLNIRIPSTVNVTNALELCSRMERHLEADGSRWWIFAPRIAFRCRREFNHVRIDGLRCDNRDRLSLLQSELKLRLELEKLWNRWNGIIDSPNTDHSSQISKLHSANSVLEDALLGGLVADAIDAIHKCDIMDGPDDWTDQGRIRTLILSCDLALARLGLQEISTELISLERSLNIGEKSHYIVGELCEAIRNRDIEKFADHKKVIVQLRNERKRMNRIDEETTHLRNVMPHLAEDLLETFADQQWDHRFASFDQSWIWAQVRSWLRDFLECESFEALSKRVDRLEGELRQYITDIASLKAWSFCFSRLEDGHRSSMEAWLQSVRRFGKGTGRHASRHRRDALNHLQNCKEAVPAWVMPLHRVWDTVRAEAEIFDYVIVDEASQCGLESLPLLYLGRKVLVVGDDKQISPEAVGLDQNSIQPWAWEYLRNLNFSSTFDVRSSLFDHGKVRFGKHKITLREHFRCMPEIIKFSNDLCYTDTPLIPLRQYGSDRLVPVQHRFVKDGYRSGSTSNAINDPEAEAVVDKIVEMCRDSRYEGKSFGVISLQGEKQALNIEHMLLKKLGPEEIKRRRLICGTAYSFQGDERDVILLSMVAAANERIGSLTKGSDERRFNVAASRARDQMILFHSIQSDELGSKCLRRRLLEFFQGIQIRQIHGMDLAELDKLALRANRQTEPAPGLFESWFEVDVALEVTRKGFEVIPQFEVSGRRIDLVVVGSSSQMALECDGDRWHGAASYDQDMVRQRQLERCGWEFFRIRQSRFYADKEDVLNELWTVLRDRNIFATAASDDSTSDARSIDSEKITRFSDVSDSVSDGVGRDLPSSTSRVATISDSELRAAIHGSIAECPNRSCTVDSLTSRVLKFLGVVTRGRPRAEFSKRVEQVTKVLESEGIIEGYRSKNARVRLL